MCILGKCFVFLCFQNNTSINMFIFARMLGNRILPPQGVLLFHMAFVIIFSGVMCLPDGAFR